MATTTRVAELTGDYVLDIGRSRIGFIARHTMASRVRGEFEEFTGHVYLDGGDPAQSRVELTIQAASIQTRNPRRDGPLRSQFLDTAAHPAITFTSTGVERIDDTHYELTGDLTIRAVTKPVTIALELTGTTDHEATFTGEVTINRKDWGVHWAAAAGMISKKVVLDLDVTVTRRP